MTAAPDPSLDARDLETVDAEVLRLSSAVRRDPQLGGCLLAFVGMLFLTLTPAVGSWLPISRGAGTALFAAAVVLLFAGAAVALVGGGLRSRRARRERAAALEEMGSLTWTDTDRQALLRAAARFVWWGGGGPGSGGHTDPEFAALLGPAGTGVVREVERHLLSRGSRE